LCKPKLPPTVLRERSFKSTGDTGKLAHEAKLTPIHSLPLRGRNLAKFSWQYLSPEKKNSLHKKTHSGLPA